MAQIITYEDLFPSSTIMHQHAGNGVITFPGAGDARLYAPNSLNCQYYVGDSAGKPPLLYERLLSMWQAGHPAQPIYIETKLSVFTGTTNLRIAGLTIFYQTSTSPILTPPFYSYQLGWYKNDGKVHVWYDYPTAETEIVTAVTAVDPASTPHCYRIYWNPYGRTMYIGELNLNLQQGYLCFAFSVNNGVTWTNLGTRAQDFSFDQAHAGIYCRKWETSAVNAQADFAYFRAREYADTKYIAPDSYGNNQDRVGFEDAGGVLSQSGPARFDSPDGIKSAFNIADVQPRTGFEDAISLPAVTGNVARFDYPDDLKADPTLEKDRVGFEESLFVQLDNTDYIKAKYDADGREYLGNYAVRHVLYYDATLDPWHTHGVGFYGAGRDGVLYYNGVACGPGDFGTLASGLRRTAWSTSDGFLDSGASSYPAPTITADGEVQFALASQLGSWTSSRMRWMFTGDFDVQVDYQILVTGSGPTDGGVSISAQIDPNNWFYARRKMWGSGAPRYDKDVRNNGSWSSYAFAATSDTSGKLRLTRVGAVVAAYYWSGSAWVQIGSNYTMTYTRPMFVDVQLGGNAIAVTSTAKCRNFTINSGSTTNLVGWAREAAGTYRGSQAAFPQHALIVSSGNSLDIIDADTNKLWMSFRGGTNNAIGGDANYYVTQAAMRDGTLFLAYRTTDSAFVDGCGYWIDFTLDFIRTHRGPNYSDSGFIYNVELTTGAWPRDSANGCIAFRNSARNVFSAHYDNWQCQNMRINWADILHYAGDQFRLIANNGGAYLCQWERWKYEGTGKAHLNTPYYGISTRTEAMRWGIFRPLSKDLLYHDRSNLWITHFASWSVVLGGGGGTWPEDHQYALAGTLDPNATGALAQDSMALDDAADLLYYARKEGVYVMNLATGVSTLFYGKAGSGASYTILPDYALVSSVKLTADGGTPLLLVGMAHPDRIWAVNRATHTIYWRGFQDDGHQPLSMAVGA